MSPLVFRSPMGYCLDEVTCTIVVHLSLMERKIKS